MIFWEGLKKLRVGTNEKDKFLSSQSRSVCVSVFIYIYIYFCLFFACISLSLYIYVFLLLFLLVSLSLSLYIYIYIYIFDWLIEESYHLFDKSSNTWDPNIWRSFLSAHVSVCLFVTHSISLPVLLPLSDCLSVSLSLYIYIYQREFLYFEKSWNIPSANEWKKVLWIGWCQEWKELERKTWKENRRNYKGWINAWLYILSSTIIPDDSCHHYCIYSTAPRNFFFFSLFFFSRF